MKLEYKTLFTNGSIDVNTIEKCMAEDYKFLVSVPATLINPDAMRTDMATIFVKVVIA